MLQAKIFYRKLEALFASIEDSAPTETLLGEVARGLTETFAEGLGIANAALYRNKEGGFDLVRAWDGQASGAWSRRLEPDSSLVHLITEHPLRIVTAGAIAPAALAPADTGRDVAWLAVGEGPDFLLAFGLVPGWKRETLDFYLNALRNDLEQRLLNAWHQHRLAEARQVQLSLLPAKLPTLPGYEFAAHSLPAEDVGGDFYDFIPVDEYVLSVAVGDASGHGFGAALQVRDVVTGLRMGIASDLKMARTVEKLNSVIARSSLTTRFVSLFYCELDRQGYLFYVNAGHPSPYHLGAGGSIQRLKVRGLVLGPKPDARYERGYTMLDNGDLLIIPSDGILERLDPEGREFGDVALEPLLLSRKWTSAREALEGIWEAAVEHGERAPWADDATLVVLRRTADPHWR